MRRYALCVITSLGILVTATNAFTQTNLIVVRRADKTLWTQRCDGVGPTACDAWTKISGLLSSQPILSWDATIGKYIMVGIGTTNSLVWKATFNPDGTFNNDWKEVKGASSVSSSASSASVAAGGSYGVAWKGMWDALTTYAVNDVVSDAGSSYISLLGGNTGNLTSDTASWGVIAQMGAPGAVGLAGPQGPAGPKGETGIPGVDGATVLNGTADPDPTTGKDGDFYLNTVAAMIFGPKTVGGWGAGTALVGPKGDKGDAGDQGVAGNLALAGTGCGAGQCITGFNAQGNPICAPLSTLLPPDPCTTTPSDITGLTGSVNTTTNYVTLNWASPATQTDGSLYNDGGGFSILRTKDGVSEGIVASLPAAQVTYTDTSVTATVGTSVYSYSIKAQDTCSPPKVSPTWISWTETYVFSACETLNPGPPMSLAVNTATTDYTGVLLTWSDPSPNPGDIQGFVIERKDVAIGTWAPIPASPLYYPTVPANSYKDTTVNPSQGAYCYRLKSFDSCPTPNYGSSYSNEACETYDPCSTTPDPPSGLTGSATAGIVTLDWSAPNTALAHNQGVAGYEIYRQTGTCGDWSLVGTVMNPATLTWQDVSITSSVWTRDYDYKLLSFKSCTPTILQSATYSNEWAESNTTNPCTSSTTVPAPGSLVAVANGACGTAVAPVSKRATLTWNFSGSDKYPPVGITRSFRIYYCDSAVCTFTCDTLGCFADSTKCAAAGQPTIISGPTEGTGGSTGYWTAVVELPDFLALHTYTFHVQQLYTSQAGACKQVSTTSKTTEACP